MKSEFIALAMVLKAVIDAAVGLYSLSDVGLTLLFTGLAIADVGTLWLVVR